MAEVVSEAVRERVLRDPCLIECLRRGIVNLSELARQVVAEVEASTGRRLSFAAAKMALYRLSKSIREGGVERVRSILRRSALVVHDSVTVATFPGESLPRVLRVAGELAGRVRFIQVTQGFKTATVVVSSEDAEAIISNVGEPLEVIGGQTAIVIVSPHDIIETPGVIAYVTGYLASNGVNVTQIISCYLDTILVVDSRESTKAYNLLRRIVGPPT